MCGLAGFINRAQQMNDESLRTITVRMTDTIAHRGPDDQGVWTDTETGITPGTPPSFHLICQPKGISRCTARAVRS